MDVLEIVIQRRSGAGWPVVVEYNRTGEFLSNMRREGLLQLDEAAHIGLRQTELDPVDYGTVLGKALFQESIRDAFMQERGCAPNIYLESGRWVTGPHGALITQAIHHKNIYRQ